MSFTDEQIAALSAPLDAKHVTQRTQAGRTLDYIEGWHAIAEANRIFGFDGWTRETVELRCVMERERAIGRDQKPGWGVTYIAKARIAVGDIVREGAGSGHGIDMDLGQAHESAIKEAETDAMKRALMTFGNPFGLALYDKTKKNVATGVGNVTGATNIMPQPERFELMTTAGEIRHYDDALAWVKALEHEIRDDPDAAEANRATAEWIYRRYKGLREDLAEIMPPKQETTILGAG